MSRGLDGKGVAAVEMAADDRPGNHMGAIPIVYHVRAGGAVANYTLCESLPFDVRIIDAHNVVTTAVAGTTVQVFAGANAVTDAMAAAVADTRTGCGTIDDTYATVAAGTALLATTAVDIGITDVYVTCLRVE